MKTKIIMVLTLGRSGSTNLIRNFSNFININVNSEIFNKNESYCNDDNKQLIISRYGKNYLKITTDKNYQIEILKYLSENCNKEFFIFKIFICQTTIEILQKMIKENIIYRIIILQRKNIIDRFISERKAYMLNEWTTFATTNYKIEFNIQKYESFKNYHKKYYSKYFKIVKDNYTYIEYNETINLDSIIKKIKSIFPELILKNNSNNCLEKQDKSKNYNDKITNYDEVKDFIEEELKTF
jgi:hypothetical protein